MYFSFEGGSCSIIDICNEYVLCYTDVTVSNSKLVIYDRERDELSEKNGIYSRTEFSKPSIQKKSVGITGILGMEECSALLI